MATTNERQREALDRAKNGTSRSNYAAILDGFAERGIFDAVPRENVFTYADWKALGRQVIKRPKGVAKGKWGVSITVWITCKDKKTGEPYKRPRRTAVFHISQTEPKKE